MERQFHQRESEKYPSLHFSFTFLGSRLGFELGRDHTIRFFAQFSGISRVKRRASRCLTIAGTCRQLHL